MEGVTPAEEATIRALLRGEITIHNFDTASAHQYDSWTDADLHRAIEHPEHEGTAFAAAEIAEYVEELRSRNAARAAQAALEERNRDKYRL